MASDEQNGQIEVDYWMAVVCPKPKNDLDLLAGVPADFGIEGEACPELLAQRWRAALFETREELQAAIDAVLLHAQDRGYGWWVNRFTFHPVRCRIAKIGGE